MQNGLKLFNSHTRTAQ